MTFTNLRYISYVVPTFAPTLAGNVAPAGGAPTVMLEDADLQARAQRLLNVIWWAQQKADAAGKPDDNTLTVFIAPEFYFRSATEDEVVAGAFDSSTRWGSYERQARDVLAAELYKAIGKAGNLSNWLIVAGTVCTWHAEGLLNTVIALRGPRAKDDGGVPYVLIEKHRISPIDGPPAFLHANENPDSIYSPARNPDRFLDNLIRWDGLLMGIEVCLDHWKRSVAAGIEELQSLFPREVEFVDLQLVTSCGMSITAAAVAVDDGDLVLLTDGMPPRGVLTPVTQAQRVSVSGPDFDLADCQQPDLQALDASANYSVPYKDYRGKQGVFIYGSQPLQQR